VPGKKILVFILLGLGSLSRSAFGGGLEITSESIVRTFQRTTPAELNPRIIPFYEYAQIDYNREEKGGLEFHSYGWTRKTITGKDYFGRDPNGELLYAYLNYSHPEGGPSFDLGRQQIFTGFLNRTIDGLKVDLGLGKFTSMTAFGGFTTDQEDVNGHSIRSAIYGGRIGLSVSPSAEFGLSYKNLQNSSDGREAAAGADMYWSPMPFLSLEGRSFFNLISQAWREHNYNVRINAASLSINPFYQRFKYKDYFGPSTSQNNLFRFLYNTDEILTSYGLELGWRESHKLELSLKDRRYNYAIREGGANFMSGTATFDVSQDFSLGTELGRMAGHTPEDSYQLYRGFCIWSASDLLGASGKISADILYQSYDVPIYGQDKSLLASISAGREFLDGKLKIKASADYSQDPFFKHDVSVIFTFLFKF
jgi:hypothetical protein